VLKDYVSEEDRDADKDNYKVPGDYAQIMKGSYPKEEWEKLTNMKQDPSHYAFAPAGRDGDAAEGGEGGEEAAKKKKKKKAKKAGAEEDDFDKVLADFKKAEKSKK